MSDWKQALDCFLIDWKDKKEVIGILVCGSYVTGNPNKRSDIDVHIIINDKCDWRERGNKYVDGFLIEYFVNPPRQIRSYFKEDFNNRRTMSMVQFISGEVIQDKHGAINDLINEARVWKEKQYKAVDASMVELKKYALWDRLDNLLDCYENDTVDFELVYFNTLLNVYSEYCSILSIEEIPYYQITRYFTDPNYLKKYLKQPFPDKQFSEHFIDALNKDNRDDKIRVVDELTAYVFKKADGFEIDGWKLTSTVDLL